MDTRNRYQRMYDARYRNAKLTDEELAIVKTRLGETDIDKFNRLSDTYGHTLRHPRTSETIRMKTGDVANLKTMPRTYRTVTPQIQYITVKRNKEGIEAEITTGKNRRKSWKSVWYSSNNRRK